LPLGEECSPTRTGSSRPSYGTPQPVGRSAPSMWTPLSPNSIVLRGPCA